MKTTLRVQQPDGEDRPVLARRAAAGSRAGRGPSAGPGRGRSRGSRAGTGRRRGARLTRSSRTRRARVGRDGLGARGWDRLRESPSARTSDVMARAALTSTGRGPALAPCDRRARAGEIDEEEAAQMAREPRSLRGKVVAITGGARGIGKATARRWCARARGSRSATSIASSPSDRRRARRRDARARARRHPARVVRELPRPGRGAARLARRAGQQRRDHAARPVRRGGRRDRAADGRHQRARRHYGMKLALPRMERRGTGHIVNIASQAGKGGFPGGATYCGTKHFVVGVSEAVRAELRDTGIEVSCRDAGGGQHRARLGPTGDPGDQEAGARGRRRRDRRRARAAEVRRLGAARDASASTRSCSCCRAGAARASAGC